jgi:DNA-directed RNA polymerase specialized sigma24 family protein
LEAHRTWVSCLKFLPDGRTLASASADMQANVHQLSGSPSWLSSIRLSWTLRHGGNQQRVDMAEADEPFATEDDEMLAVNEALDRLAANHPVEADLVKQRYFAGMTNDEAEQALGISTRTAKYYWTHARAWLYHAITTGAVG